MNSPLDPLYDGTDGRDAQICLRLGKAYQPPSRFIHGKWHLVASLPKDPESGDGFPVEIHEVRMPARFFKVEALPSTDSMKRARPGFALSTGSGDDMGALCAQMALAIAGGMLLIHPKEDQ